MIVVVLFWIGSKASEYAAVPRAGTSALNQSAKLQDMLSVCPSM